MNDIQTYFDNPQFYNYFRHLAKRYASDPRTRLGVKRNALKYVTYGDSEIRGMLHCIMRKESPRVAIERKFIKFLANAAIKLINREKKNV